jgi:hypothetical protein
MNSPELVCPRKHDGAVEFRAFRHRPWNLLLISLSLRDLECQQQGQSESVKHYRAPREGGSGCSKGS